MVELTGACSTVECSLCGLLFSFDDDLFLVSLCSFSACSRVVVLALLDADLVILFDSSAGTFVGVGEVLDECVVEVCSIGSS